VLAGAAVIVVAAGVGGGGLASGAFARPRPVVQDSASSAPVTTASFSFKLAVKGLVRHGGTVALSGTGQVDFGADAVSAAITLPPSVAALIPGGTASATTVDAVLSGGTVYAEIPGLSSLVHKPWISISLPAGVTSAIPGGFSTVAGALGSVNEILTFARGHHAKVVSLGSGTVGGAPASIFGIGGRIDGVKVAAKLWADGSGRLVQAALQAGSRGAGVSGTIDFSGYGAPVTVTVPPSSEVQAIPLSLVENVLGGLLGKAHLGGLFTHAA